MSFKPHTSKEEERELVDILNNGLGEELLQREMGHFWMTTVKMSGPIIVTAVLIPDALFLFFGILGFFNVAGGDMGVWHRLAYLAIAFVGFVLSFLMWKAANVATITLLRAVYVMVTGLACLVTGIGGLILSYPANNFFPILIHASILNGIMWLVLGFLTFLAPILLAYAAFRYYLTIMAYGHLW